MSRRKLSELRKGLPASLKVGLSWPPEERVFESYGLMFFVRALLGGYSKRCAICGFAANLGLVRTACRKTGYILGCWPFEAMHVGLSLGCVEYRVLAK